MAGRPTMEAVSGVLQNVCGDDRPYAGKFIIFVGDFNQLEAISGQKISNDPDGTKAQAKLLFNSPQLKHFTIYWLGINERASSDALFAPNESCSSRSAG